MKINAEILVELRQEIERLICMSDSERIKEGVNANVVQLNFLKRKLTAKSNDMDKYIFDIAGPRSKLVSILEEGIK